MDYEIVPKPDFSDYRHGSKPFWEPLLANLPPNQAVKFVCATKKEANNRQASAHTATAKGMYKIKIHTRIIPESDKFALYIWKDSDAPQS